MSLISFKKLYEQNNDETPIKGLPQKPIDIGNGKSYIPSPNAKIRKVAASYMKSAGMPYNPPTEFKPVNPAKATQIAGEYDKMKHDPNHPKVKASYEALAKETMAQFHHIKKSGLKISWVGEGQADPYAKTPHLGAVDVRENNHLHVLKTDTSFGTGENENKDHPMLAKTGVVENGHHMLVNDAFRAVHDYFGHYKEGFGFRASGEDNAWRHHASMFSPLARGAMTTETRGQNSFVNYGPHGDHNRKATGATTIYADQKAGLMPEHTQRDEPDL